MLFRIACDSTAGDDLDCLLNCLDLLSTKLLAGLEIQGFLLARGLEIIEVYLVGVTSTGEREALRHEEDAVECDFDCWRGNPQPGLAGTVANCGPDRASSHCLTHELTHRGTPRCGTSVPHREMAGPLALHAGWSDGMPVVAPRAATKHLSFCRVLCRPAINTCTWPETS